MRARGDSWRWSPGETVARISAAVLKGTPTLTIQQRMTLMIYVEHLNEDRLEQGVACVWPSTHLVASYLGCSERQARENRRSLEAAGFLVRDYTRANRPAGVEAYDLRPLMARLDELDGGRRGDPGGHGGPQGLLFRDGFPSRGIVPPRRRWIAT